MVVWGHYLELMLTYPTFDPTFDMPRTWSMAPAYARVAWLAQRVGAAAVPPMSEPDPALRRQWRSEDQGTGPPGHAAAVSPISSNAPPAHAAAPHSWAPVTLAA